MVEQAKPVLRLGMQSTSAVDTRALGVRLGALLRGGDVIALSGDLGAGKTTLAQGIALGLGVRARVTSPTFTLVNEYPTIAGWRLAHVDGYRLGASLSAAAQEAETVGLEDLLADDRVILVIEWAERVAALLPGDRLDIRLDYAEDNPDGRSIVIEACGPRSVTLLHELRPHLAGSSELPAR